MTFYQLQCLPPFLETAILILPITIITIIIIFITIITSIIITAIGNTGSVNKTTYSVGLGSSANECRWVRQQVQESTSIADRRRNGPDDGVVEPSISATVGFKPVVGHH